MLILEAYLQLVPWMQDAETIIPLSTSVIRHFQAKRCLAPQFDFVYSLSLCFFYTGMSALTHCPVLVHRTITVFFTSE